MEDTNKGTTNKMGLLCLGAIFLIGYGIGTINAGKLITEAYERGSRDVLKAIIFKQEL